jgi:peptide/nickel transport system substrate-binding protein
MQRIPALPCALLATLVLACSGPPGAATRAPERAAEGPRAAGPRRITVAMKTVPPFLYQKLNPANVSGGPEVSDLVSVGLTTRDDRGELAPILAEAVPTTENGLWRVFPDGRMETTWRIRAGAAWHDGTPLSADDLLFTARVVQDRELSIFRERGYELIESVEAPDARTVAVTWRRPFIEADSLFGVIAVPMPKHLLERPYADDKASFTDIPYWSHEFVGTGPFRLKEYVQGSHLVAQANERYTLGRPKLDEVEVRFITDDNTLIASLLSGAVDLTLGRGPSMEQALQVREQWRDGRAEFKSLDIWIVIYPQFLNPTPAIVAQTPFRRALLHAIDRQEMVESIQAGLVPVAQSLISPNLAFYPDVERQIVRYDYDPRRANQIIDGLGYSRGPDGFYRDAGGQRLSVGVQVTTVLDIQPKTAFPVADYWQRVGVGVDVDVVPPQRGQDLEYRANFPSFALQRQPANLRPLPNLHSAQARTAEKGYTGTNNARYINTEMDSLIDRYLTTIPVRDRVQIIGRMVHQITDELIWMGLFFDSEPSLIANRLVNVTARPDDSRHTWNAHLWDIK